MVGLAYVLWVFARVEPAVAAMPPDGKIYAAGMELGATRSSFLSALETARFATKIGGEVASSTESSWTYYTLAYPIFSQPENPRQSGWAIGLEAGFQKADTTHTIIRPEAFSTELSLGRANYEFLPLSDTGLTGFFQVGFRWQTPMLKALDREVFETLSIRRAQDPRRMIAVRAGAGKHLDGHGLVSQSPGKLAFQIQSDFFIPLEENGSTALQFHVTSLTRWPLNWSSGWKALAWGMNAKVFYVILPLDGESELINENLAIRELEWGFRVGPKIQWTPLKDLFLLDLSALWGSYHARNDYSASASDPSVSLDLTFLF